MNKILQWWLGINWKTRSISIVVLILSIVISSITFARLFSLQVELINTNFRFFRDISSLIAYDITNLMQNVSEIELKDSIERIYLTTSSIDYLQLFDNKGYIILSFPVDSLIYKYVVDLHFNILDTRYYIYFFNIPLLVPLIFGTGSILNCVIPLIVENKLLGFLQLGLNFNNNISNFNTVTQYVSSVIFVITWLFFILGSAFNFFTIIEPISEILMGMQNIAFGNFGYSLPILGQGSFRNLIVTFNEMSKRLQFYENNNIAQLASEKAKLESLAGNMTDGALLLDSELRILLVNQIVVKMLHLSNKDLIGDIIFKHLPNHVNESLLPILNIMVQSNYFEDKTVNSQELIINFNDESLKTFRFVLSSILIYNHKYLNGIVITIKDITKENQLSEVKNRFISNVSHELRTPLCNIGSFLETLIDYKYKLTSEQKDQFLEIAYSETQRLNSLVNDILDLSRLESESIYILKPIVLINTILYIIQASQIMALNKQVQILVEIHPSIDKILAHQNSLCQVLSNLISNSLKFTHREGRIIIRVYPLLIKRYNILTNYSIPDIVRLEIIDEGVGINSIFQKYIFDRFMRIENNIHTLKGTGLGLSIVQNIVKKHNSTVSVYSEVDIGTSFWFDLFFIH